MVWRLYKRALALSILEYITSTHNPRQGFFTEVAERFYLKITRRSATAAADSSRTGSPHATPPAPADLSHIRRDITHTQGAEVTPGDANMRESRYADGVHGCPVVRWTQI